MPDDQPQDNPFRAIPSVNDLADAPALREWSQRLPRSLVVEAAQQVLAEHRRVLAKNGRDHAATTLEQLSERVAAALAAADRPVLPAVINATGIIIHTGLGRSPMPERAVRALADAAGRYAPVELDMETGGRGKRSHVVRPLLCAVTGAESATVVNNCAAALVLTLSTLAKGRAVVVSRGELIEIGGSFRLPDVMAASGAELREVGTTNKTRISDYEGAIDDSVAALLKVHPSNYRIEGFTQGASIEELAELGSRWGLPVIHDVGSGAVHDFNEFGLPDEPTVQTSVEAGADLVLFSGDKLLGGPQAGVIVGRSHWVDRIESNPLMRALRVDKLTLAALGETLRLHRDQAQARREVPVLAMVTADLDELRRRAERLADALDHAPGLSDVQVVDTTVYLGGGSLPTQGLPSVAVRVSPDDCDETELARGLRTADPPVVARVHGGAVLFELRTVMADQDAALAEAVAAAAARAG